MVVVFKVRGMQRVKVRDMDGEKKSNVSMPQRRVEDTTASKAMTTMDTDDTPTCPAALLEEVSFPELGVLEGAPPLADPVEFVLFEEDCCTATTFHSCLINAAACSANP